MQKKDTGHVYAMKILRKADMLEKEQVGSLPHGFFCYWLSHYGLVAPELLHRALTFRVALPNSQALCHKSSFIPRTSNLWNILSSCFPESYNLLSFKSEINKLDLIPLSS